MLKLIINGHQKTFVSEEDFSFFLKEVRSNQIDKDELQWKILRLSGIRLQEIIETTRGLKDCLNVLNENNSLFLLLHLKNKLGKIIEGSYELSELLSKLKKERTKLFLLKSLRFRGLKGIIKDANDLYNVLEFFFEEKSQRKLLDTLGEDFIKDVFLSTNEIKIVLNLLFPSNKEKILKMIGIKNLKNKTRNSEHFLALFRSIPENFEREFLDIFVQMEYEKLFVDCDFESFCIRLHKEKVLKLKERINEFNKQLGDKFMI